MPLAPRRGGRKTDGTASDQRLTPLMREPWAGPQLLTSREIGMLAAVGRVEVPVVRRPRVAILSTGDELVPPGAAARPGQVYDSNAAVLAAAVEEEGGFPVRYGISL